MTTIYTRTNFDKGGLETKILTDPTHKDVFIRVAEDLYWSDDDPDLVEAFGHKPTPEEYLQDESCDTWVSLAFIEDSGITVWHN